jgi:tellurite resistance protein
MPSRISAERRKAAATATLPVRLNEGEVELLDAMATVGALVASADGRVDPSEPLALADFVDRQGVFSVFTRDEILDAFTRRLRAFETKGAAGAAVECLERFAGRAPARLLIEASRQVAAADGRLHPRELHFLQLIHIALVAPFSRIPLHAGA